MKDKEPQARLSVLKDDLHTELNQGWASYTAMT